MNNQETYLLKLKSSSQRKIILFYHSPTRIVEYVSEYTFLISKNNNNNKKAIKKAKETKEEKIISSENRLKKINLLPPW